MPKSIFFFLRFFELSVRFRDWASMMINSVIIFYGRDLSGRPAPTWEGLYDQALTDST